MLCRTGTSCYSVLMFNSTFSRRAAGIEYTLTRKDVKRINLRVRRDGSVAVSASKRESLRDIDAFVGERAEWIIATQAHMHQTENNLHSIDSNYDSKECLHYFEAIAARMWPLVATQIGTPPRLRVRLMKTRWGVCNLQSRSITLNKALVEKPLAAIEYVILHEYVHFIHPDHQRGFHNTMAALMPDYKSRRALLS